MNLLELRQAFLKRSGRSDLVNPTTFADNGANDLIKFGQEYLEGRLDINKSVLRYQKNVTVNTFRLIIPSLVVAKEVTLANVDGLIGLERKTLAWLHEEYGSRFEDITVGSPLYYAVVDGALHESQKALTSATYTGQFTYNEETLILADQGDRHTDTLLIVLPPADDTYTVTVHGKFVAAKLTNNTDTNIWSVSYPRLLLLAALRELEIDMRNTEGMRDRTIAIDALLFGIDKDIADSESVGYDRMERVS